MKERARYQLTGAHDALARFQAVLDELVGPLGNLAAVAGIAVDGVGRYHLAAGHADLERTEPASPAHRYQIGSQSKTAVAVALLLLARDGLIDLDRSVADDIKLQIDPRISSRHLIMNSSGLGEMTFAVPLARYDPRVALPPRDLVALALPQGQQFPPGDRFDYCNTGWVIAALLIEQVTGEPYEAVIGHRILEPLGLAHTSFGRAPSSEPFLRGYVESSATAGMLDTTGHLGWAFGAGDGVSTIDDMLTFFGALGRPNNALGIGLAELAAETLKPSAVPNFPLSVGTEYGFGVERRLWAGREVWGHPGSTLSHMSGSWIDAGRGVTVTTCVTRALALPAAPDADLRYPRAQLFAMALNTAYALADAAAARHDKAARDV